MDKKTFSRRVLYLLMMILATLLVTTGCTASETIRGTADSYLSSDKEPNITAEQLYEVLFDGNPSNDPIVLSVRSHEDYANGHIPGAINIPWREVAKQENMAKLPKNRQIVVYCHTGHTASQIVALLNIMDYEAVNLKFGMTSWTINRNIAPGRFVESQDSHDYPLVIAGVEVPKCPTCS